MQFYVYLFVVCLFVCLPTLNAITSSTSCCCSKTLNLMNCTSFGSSSSNFAVFPTGVSAFQSMSLETRISERERERERETFPPTKLCVVEAHKFAQIDEHNRNLLRRHGNPSNLNLGKLFVLSRLSFLLVDAYKFALSIKTN